MTTPRHAVDDQADPALEALPWGAIRPRGWLLAQLRRDLTQGFAARLDELTDHAANDLFRHRVGTSPDQLGWWDAETRGHWLLGLVQMSALADDEAARGKAEQLTRDLLATQDDDGYLGIYTPGSRYAHPPGENGELWAQSRALLVLLTHHELTGDPQVLAAVRAAVEVTLARYGRDLGAAFAVTGEEHDGDLVGLFHGLMFTDVLEWLAELTGAQGYLDAAVGLYDAFCSLPGHLPNDDMRLDRILAPEVTLRGHAAHTAEHLRTLGLAAAVTGREDLRAGRDAALAKIAVMTGPSGALIGDESIHGLPGPTAGYEYCTMLELLRSLTAIFRRTHDLELLDWAELLVCNAAQGARLPDGTAINYLSQDTREAALATQLDPYSARTVRFDPALSGLHRDDPVEPWEQGARSKFSATHADVAVCCNPNAIRLLPEYIARMWLRTASRDTLVAAFYGPCELDTELADVPVHLALATTYPFEETVTITVTPREPVAFALQLRVPAWATGVEVETPEATQRADGPRTITLRRTWAPDDRVVVRFATEVRTIRTTDGSWAIRRGPLRYVQPIAHVERPIGTAPLPGLGDRELVPAVPQSPPPPVLLDADGTCPDARLVRRAGDADDPWRDPPVTLEVDGRTLVPLGCAMLRRATFATR
ncbi:MAG: glycoside hydrolase family 127 protein [Nitriliruptoraceae bacterium]|nr:glycoside hydrolase family 127 protein [Nitriliruptoraceae bacterium]